MKLNLRSIDLNLLTVFEAVWEERQLSRAAERLGMTQSAASQALARLRLTFDDELFMRAQGGMVPTVRAITLAQPITEGLQQLREACAPVGPFDPRQSERSFKIAFTRYGEVSLFSALLRHLDTLGSKAKVVSYAGDRGDGVDLLTSHGVDFVFDYQKPRHSALASCHFEDEEMVVIARRNHPRIGKGLSRKQYFSERHIALAMSNERRTYLENAIAKDYEPRIVVAQTDQAAVLPQLIASTDALATLPRRVAEAALLEEHVQVYDIPLKLPKVPVYMVWRRATESDKGHIWLRERLMALRS